MGGLKKACDQIAEGAIPTHEKLFPRTKLFPRKSLHENKDSPQNKWKFPSNIWKLLG